MAAPKCEKGGIEILKITNYRLNLKSSNGSKSTGANAATELNNTGEGLAAEREMANRFVALEAITL